MQNQFISIFNDGNFIRVFNANTKTTTYFNKNTISIQMDNVSSFFLKNDTNIGFYNYNDIKAPLSVSINELVYTLVRWAESLVKTENWDLNHAYSLLELQMRIDNNPIEIDELIYNTGTSNFDDVTQLVLMAVNDKDSKVIRQSKMVMKYRLGLDILAVVSGTLIGPTIPQNTIYRIGLFEDVDDRQLAFSTGSFITAGCFFQYDSVTDTISVVLRRNNVPLLIPDLVVTQTDWNIDTLDGSGVSSLNINLYTNLTFIYELRHRQGTIMKLGVMYNDTMVFCHEFIESVEYTPSLPIRWEISGNKLPTSTVCSGNMLQGYAIVYGKQNRTNNDIRVSGMTSVQKSIAATDVNVNLIAIRLLLPSASKCHIKLYKIQIINTQIGFAKWDLVLNPIGLDTLDFVDGDSIIQKNEYTYTVTGGTILASGYVGSNTIETIDLDSNFYPITTSINGISDVITLRINGMNGTVNVGANISWREYI